MTEAQQQTTEPAAESPTQSRAELLQRATEGLTAKSSDQQPSDEAGQPADAPGTAAGTKPEPTDRPRGRDWIKLRKERKELQARRAEFEAARAAAEAAKREADEVLALASPERARELLERAKITPRQLAEWVVGEDGSDAATKQLARELEVLRAEHRGLAERLEQERTSAQRERDRASSLAVIGQTLEGASDQYPYLAALDRQEISRSVLDLMVDHHRRTGEMLALDDALWYANGELEAQYTRIRDKMGTSSRASRDQAPRSKAAKPERSRSSPLADPSAAESVSGRPLTRDERLERAIAAIKTN